MRRLLADDVSLIATIDRSEHVDVQYGVIDGQIDFCASLIADGAVLLGTFDSDRPVGLAVVDPSFDCDSRLAWLAVLYVSRPHRRRGAARALWGAAVDLALAAGAESIYVSAVPTGSAVGFYLRQGCRLADPVHPELFAEEPDDIHLVRSLP